VSDDNDIQRQVREAIAPLEEIVAAFAEATKADSSRRRVMQALSGMAPPPRAGKLPDPAPIVARIRLAAVEMELARRLVILFIRLKTWREA
jgi:hypothetical protein